MTGTQCPASRLQGRLGRASAAAAVHRTAEEKLHWGKEPSRDLRGKGAGPIGRYTSSSRTGAQANWRTGSLTRGGAPSVGVSEREESSCGGADKWGDSSGKDVPRRGSPDKESPGMGVPRCGGLQRKASLGGLQMKESPGIGVPRCGGLQMKESPG